MTENILNTEPGLLFNEEIVEDHDDLVDSSDQEPRLPFYEDGESEDVYEELGDEDDGFDEFDLSEVLMAIAERLESLTKEQSVLSAKSTYVFDRFSEIEAKLDKALAVLAGSEPDPEDSEPTDKVGRPSKKPPKLVVPKKPKARTTSPAKKKSKKKVKKSNR